MQKGRGSRRLGKQYQTKEDMGWAWMGPGRSAQAGRPGLFRGPVGLPFDLIASRVIYSPLTKRHASINSSSAARGAEKLEGHHLGDEGRASCLGFP
jgi:hypothetical protein